jgi:heat shock protein HslJ
VSSTIEGATVVFADGKVQVVTGCNQISGAAVIGEGTIEAGPLGSTKMGCPPDVAQLESAVAATFDGTIEFTIEAGSLTLTGPNGTGLMLTAP